MKNMIKKTILAASLVFVSQSAFAAFTAAGTVTKVQLGQAGDLFITTTAPKINPAGCTATTYFLSKDFAPFNKYYAALLTAQASGANVKLSVSDGSCAGVYPLLNGMTVE